MIRHPSKKLLRAWLGGAEDEDVDRHLANCERCASLLEDLDEPVSDGRINAALTTVLAPPPDLADRLEAQVVARLGSREVFGYMADLFGAGMETTRLLFTEDPPERGATNVDN